MLIPFPSHSLPFPSTFPFRFLWESHGTPAIHSHSHAHFLCELESRFFSQLLPSAFVRCIMAPAVYNFTDFTLTTCC